MKKKIQIIQCLVLDLTILTVNLIDFGQSQNVGKIYPNKGVISLQNNHEKCNATPQFSIM